jgi:hypothetical protein
MPSGIVLYLVLRRITDWEGKVDKVGNVEVKEVRQLRVTHPCHDTFAHGRLVHKVTGSVQQLACNNEQVT